MLNFSLTFSLTLIDKNTPNETFDFISKFVDKTISLPNFNINHNFNGSFALCLAIQYDSSSNGKTNIFNKIFNHKDININQRDKEGNNALIHIALSNQFEYFKKFVSHKDFNWGEKNGKFVNSLEMIMVLSNMDFVEYALSEFPNETLKPFETLEMAVSKYKQNGKDLSVIPDALKRFNIMKTLYQKNLLDSELQDNDKKMKVKM